VFGAFARRLLSWHLHGLDLSRPIVAATYAQGSRNRAVRSLKIKALRVKLASAPALIGGVLLMVRIKPCLKERLIAGVSADILRRTAARSGNAARIFDARRRRHFSQDEPVPPVVAEAVLVEKFDLYIEFIAARLDKATLSPKTSLVLFFARLTSTHVEQESSH